MYAMIILFLRLARGHQKYNVCHDHTVPQISKRAPHMYAMITLFSNVTHRCAMIILFLRYLYNPNDFWQVKLFIYECVIFAFLVEDLMCKKGLYIPWHTFNVPLQIYNSITMAYMVVFQN